MADGSLGSCSFGPRRKRSFVGFAGIGGSSIGVARATGYDPHFACNHDRVALAVHEVNHPATHHMPEDIWKIRFRDFLADGDTFNVVWLSPDCRDFSRAKGGKPIDKKIRGLAWFGVKLAEQVEQDVGDMLVYENVPEFEGWCPLDKATGKRIKSRKGETFRRFVKRHERLGYVVEWKVLKACDYGSPTSRKRLYVIARKGMKPVWPEPTHADPKTLAASTSAQPSLFAPKKLKPWRIAAECIDFSLPCPSIFDRAKPLKPATLRRIAKGIVKYVLNGHPFLANTRHAGDDRIHSVDEPMPTVPASDVEVGIVNPVIVPVTHTKAGDRVFDSAAPLTAVTTAKGGELGVAAFFGVPKGWGERKGQAPRCQPVTVPLTTVVGDGEKHGLVAAFLAKHYGGHESPGSSPAAPMDTVTAADHHGLVTSHLAVLRNNCSASSLDDPAPAVCAGGQHLAEVRALLVEYYKSGRCQDPAKPLGTVTTHDRFGLVTVVIDSVEYVIVDIGFRMLTPRELARAQGFPDSFVLDPVVSQWSKKKKRWMPPRRLSKKAQIKGIGNSVCPQVAEAIVSANLLQRAA